MSLLSVAQLVGIEPFGPFNRWGYEPLNIYLESGMLDLKSIGFKDPEAYKPANWKTSLAFTPITGQLNLELSGYRNDASSPPEHDAKIRSLRYRPVTGTTSPSKAIGCDKKSKNVDMIDPRGEGLECSGSYTPSFVPPVGLDPLSVLYGNVLNSMISQAEAIVSGNTYSNVVREDCIQRDTTPTPTQSQEAEFCSQSIIYKKWGVLSIPSSLFTGKLKLYVQCIYGGVEVPWEYKQDDFTKYILIGQESVQLQNRTMAPRAILLEGKGKSLYTDSFHNFYIVSHGTNLKFNKLEPNPAGLRLQKYLIEYGSSLNESQILAYEAYILTTCTPSKYISLDTNLDINEVGFPFDHGWKANNKGDKLSWVGVTYKKGSAIRKTTLVTISLTESGIQSLYASERTRKIESLRSQALGLIGAPGTTTAVYSTTSARIVNAGQTNEYIDGNLDFGYWYYVVVPLDENDTTAATLESEENSDWGGLPNSKTFYLSLKNHFSANLSIQETGEFLEQMQTDKIFRWDPYFGLYEWLVPWFPNDGLSHESPVASNVPVYCFYDKNDHLVVIRYSYKPRSSGDDDENFSFPLLCGPGPWEYCIISKGAGFESGFSSETINLSRTRQSSTFTTHKKGKVGTGVFMSGWGTSCEPSFCDSEPPAVIHPIGSFWSHWMKSKIATATDTTTTFSGELYYYNALVIPKDDCESVFLLQKQELSGQLSRISTQWETAVGARAKAIEDKSYDAPAPADCQGWLACAPLPLWLTRVTFGGAAGNTFNVTSFGTYQYSCSAYRPGQTIKMQDWGDGGLESYGNYAVSNYAPVDATILENTSKRASMSKGLAYLVGRLGEKPLVEEVAGDLSYSGTCANLSLSGTNQQSLKKFLQFNEFTQSLPLIWPYNYGGLVLDIKQSVQGITYITSPSEIKVLLPAGFFDGKSNPEFSANFSIFTGYY